MKLNFDKDKMIVRKIKDNYHVKIYGEMKYPKNKESEEIFAPSLTHIVNSFISENKIVKLEDELEIFDCPGIYSLVAANNNEELYLHLTKDDESLKNIENIINKYVSDRNSFIFENLKQIKKLELNLTNKTSYEKTEDGFVLNLKYDKDKKIHEMEKNFLMNLFKVLFDNEEFAIINGVDKGYFSKNGIDVIVDNNLCKVIGKIYNRKESKVKILEKKRGVLDEY